MSDSPDSENEATAKAMEDVVLTAYTNRLLAEIEPHIRRMEYEYELEMRREHDDHYDAFYDRIR